MKKQQTALIILGFIIVTSAWISRSSLQIESRDDTTTRAATSKSQTLYPYGNLTCPFEMAVFSQHFMASRTSSIPDLDHPDPFLYGEERAEAARQLAMDEHTFETVKDALELGKFNNRTISLYGDSHTRQLFMALGCLIHAASEEWIGNTDLKWIHTKKMKGPGSKQMDLLSEVPTENHSKLEKGTIWLRGGGQIIYQWYPWPTKIKKSWTAACKRKEPLLNLTSRDVLVVSAGTHHNARDFLLNTLVELASCVSEQRSNGKLLDWPTMAYMLNPFTHFMTKDGAYSSDHGDSQYCRKDAPYKGFQEGEKAAMAPYLGLGIKMFLGGTLDETELGHLHPMHGDCAHYLQPGVPDVKAADLARLVASLDSN